MARKEKKYHFIYKTTNLLNGKYYIGLHSTDNLDDGYMGSGRRLRYSINKYGKDNHKREIVEFVDTRKELYLREEEIVNLNEIAKVDCMNLCVGGVAAGFIDEEHRKKCSDAGNIAYTKRMKEDVELRKQVSERMSKTNLKRVSSGEHKNWKDNYDWSNKKHSEETKKKISETNKGRGTGSSNSQFGTCWITNGKENKKIKKEDLNNYISNGWLKGRK